MKRMIPLLLTLLMLWGCGTSEPAPVEDARLTQLLTEVDNTMQPGTAGSSLKAAYLAALLLDWSRETELDEASIAAITQAAAANARTDQPAGFSEKMQSVFSAYELLMTPEGEGLLTDCGYTGSGYPWTEEDAAAFKCIMETINAM